MRDTKIQRDKETKRQRDKETTRQRDKETKRQRNKEAEFDLKFNYLSFHLGEKEKFDWCSFQSWSSNPSFST